MREKEVREKIAKAGGRWEVFQVWMRGQTCSMYEDGATNFYDHDVNRFVRYNCNPNNEPLMEWD